MQTIKKAVKSAANKALVTLKNGKKVAGSHFVEVLGFLAISVLIVVAAKTWFVGNDGNGGVWGTNSRTASTQIESLFTAPGGSTNP